ncbi:MAG: gliding motility-associated C-terminal domain-containing protein, partial [Xanthomarina sp.]
ALDDASFTMTPTCDGGTTVITGDVGGVFSFNPIPGDNATIDPATGEITNGDYEATYTVEYTTAGSCPATSTQTVTVLSVDSPAFFTVIPTCDGGTVDMSGSVIGGVFTLNPEPQDGATINAATGQVKNGKPNTTYTIEYTTAGSCPVTSNETFITGECGVIPQVITPNGDGINDSFDLSNYNVESLEIFNRHGVKVYSKTNYTNEFIGLSDQGHKLPTGTYFYIMKYQGSEVKSAWLYINREK